MIDHFEIRGSRDGIDANDRSSRASLTWRTTGSNNTTALRAYLTGVVPATYDGLVYRSLSWDQVGHEIYDFTATYLEADRTDREHKLTTGGSSLFSFDTTGGSVMITTSRYGTTRYAQGVAADDPSIPDFDGAINVAEGDVKGTTIVIPALNFRLKKRIALATIDTAWLKAQAGLTGTVNNAVYNDFAAGELLFRGCSGQQGTDADPEVTWHFSASANLAGLSIGQIANVAKKGHEYLWVLFEPVDQNASKFTVRQPKAAYVEKVYQEADWSSLIP